MSRLAFLVFAASALLAHGDVSSVTSQEQSGTPDADRIVASSIAATQRHWQARLHYTYIERDESRRRDLAGRVTSEDIEVSRTSLVNGLPFEQVVQRNGQPPSAEEQRHQQEDLGRLKRETPARLAERVREQEAENLSLVREVPKAFDFQLMGEEVVNGRPAYVLHATPHAGYYARGTYGKSFAKLEGNLWIDRQDLGLVKVDGQVIQSISIGFFVVRLLRGSQITLEQSRIDDGIWMPQRVEVRAAAKIFFVKSLVIDRVLTYSEYRLADAGVPVPRDPVNPMSPRCLPGVPKETGQSAVPPLDCDKGDRP